MHRELRTPEALDRQIVHADRSNPPCHQDPLHLGDVGEIGLKAEFAPALGIVGTEQDDVPALDRLRRERGRVDHVPATQIEHHGFADHAVQRHVTNRGRPR